MKDVFIRLFFLAFLFPSVVYSQADFSYEWEGRLAIAGGAPVSIVRTFYKDDGAIPFGVIVYDMEYNDDGGVRSAEADYFISNFSEYPICFNISYYVNRTVKDAMDPFTYGVFIEAGEKFTATDTVILRAPDTFADIEYIVRVVRGVEGAC